MELICFGKGNWIKMLLIVLLWLSLLIKESSLDLDVVLGRL